MVNRETIFRDAKGEAIIVAATDVNHFKGIIDEVRIYNHALNKVDMKKIAGKLFSVNPKDKIAAT